MSTVPTTIYLVLRSRCGMDGGPVVYTALTDAQEAERTAEGYCKVLGSDDAEEGYLYVEEVELHPSAASAIGIA